MMLRREIPWWVGSLARGGAENKYPIVFGGFESDHLESNFEVPKLGIDVDTNRIIDYPGKILITSSMIRHTTDLEVATLQYYSPISSVPSLDTTTLTVKY
jgi:hypothetical protein